MFELNDKKTVIMFLYLFPYLTLYVMGTKKKCLNETFFLHTQNMFELNDKKPS